MILVILIIPVLSLDFVEDNKRNELLELGDSNFVYKSLSNEIVDKTVINDMLVPYNLVDITDWDNNSTIVNYEIWGINIDVLYTDNITYIGNDTYIIDTNGFLYDNIIIPLNITNYNLTESFIIHSNIEPYLFIMNEDDSLAYTFVESYEIDTDKWIFIIPLSIQVLLNSMPDNNLMLGYDNVDTNVNIEFSIFYGEENNTSLFELTDMTQYYIILTSSIAISIFTLIFMTQTIDIVFDMKDKRKNKWRK